MKNRVIIDCESRSFDLLDKSNAYQYWQHESTQLMCLSYKFEDQKTRLIPTSTFFNYPHLVKKTYLYELAANKEVTFEAHNATFEINMWAHHMVKKYHMPVIELERWFCSMAKCAYNSLPYALGQAAEVLKLKNQKDADGHALMLKMCKPRKPTKNNPAIWHETPEQIKRQEQYCIQDVNAEYELSEALPELPEYERKIWLMDQRINARGIRVDLESVNKLISIVDKAKEANKKEIQKITGGVIDTPNQRDKILKLLKENNCELDNLQKDTVEKALENKELKPLVRKILEIRKKSGKASTSKLKAMQRLSVLDGRVYGAFFYYGGRTGRWSSKGLQLHNMIKKTFAGIDLEVALDCLDSPIEWISCLFENTNLFVSKLIRPMFISDNDKVLISSDFSSIEAKLLLWNAQDKVGLQLYRDNKCLYVWMASKIFKIPESEVTKDQRFVGKQCILGLGYGMGVDRFIEQCLQYGRVVSRSLAERSVKTYRNSFPSVAGKNGYWRKVEGTFRNCLMTKRAQKFHNLIFRYNNKSVYIDLPSDRSLCYQKAFIDEFDRICYWGIHSKTKKWSKLDTWGGKITGHIVQSMARDAMAQAMLRLEEQNFPVVLHVHDEPVCEVSPTKADLKKFKSILNDKESWLKGCPIDTDSGWFGKRYRKA